MNDRLLTLNALFDRTFSRHGDAVAVKDAGREWSYRALNARANALAHELGQRGVGRDDAVLVHAERSASTVAAVVAVLKAGAAFIPVSLDTPPARIESVIRDAAPKLLLTDRAGRPHLAGRDVILIDDDRPGMDRAPQVDVAPQDVAYIIYTSGTSGEPKGIMIEHGSIARRFHDWDAAFGLSVSAVRLLQVAKLGFDVFVGDVVKVLGSGGTLVVCPSDVVLDPARLHHQLAAEAIDYVDIVPAVLRELLDHLQSTAQDLASLRMLNVGADLWTKEEYERALRVTRVARLFNSYGPTECTVENTLFEDDGTLLGDRNLLPIGRPHPSDEMVILDHDLLPVPPGVAGQICIGGPCVARGYVNRPELNARAFFIREGVRFYKTGDLGRVDAAGQFEFLGRIDSQVKINGNRVELEEIERVLERFPSVRQAVVCADADRSALTAFVKAGPEAFEAGRCKAHLARHLPSYMLPARIVAVDVFPLNQNGKVDRARLSAEAAVTPTQAPHDLHEIVGASDLRARLSARGVDLLSLVNEFVKPSARFGVVVTGALVNGTATGASPLELLVVIGDGGDLKRRRSDVAGCAVHYGITPGGTRVSLRTHDLDVVIDFVVIDFVAGDASRDRLAPDWTLHGHDVIERWRRAG